jgi:hypothetical protein
MSDNVIRLPGAQESLHPPGEPRHDIADMLRDVADRAERGEIDALVIGFSIVNGGMGTGVSTPENAYYSMLGVCAELQGMIRERAPAQRTIADRDP